MGFEKQVPIEGEDEIGCYYPGDLDRTLEANIGLCRKLAGKWCYYADGVIDFDDLLQEACIKFSMLFPGFDPGYGVKFSTYVYEKIDKYLFRVFASEHHIGVRLPENVYSDVLRVDSTAAELHRMGVDRSLIDVERIASVSEMTEKRVKAAMCLSSSSRLDVSVIDWVEVARVAPDLSGLEVSDARNFLDKLKLLLEEGEYGFSDRDKEMVVLYLGLNGGERLTLYAIGDKFDYVAERVRQIVNGVLKKFGLRLHWSRLAVDDPVKLKDLFGVEVEIKGKKEEGNVSKVEKKRLVVDGLEGRDADEFLERLNYLLGEMGGNAAMASSYLGLSGVGMSRFEDIAVEVGLSAPVVRYRIGSVLSKLGLKCLRGVLFVDDSVKVKNLFGWEGPVNEDEVGVRSLAFKVDGLHVNDIEGFLNLFWEKLDAIKPYVSEKHIHLVVRYLGLKNGNASSLRRVVKGRKMDVNRARRMVDRVVGEFGLKVGKGGLVVDDRVKVKFVFGGLVDFEV